MAYEAARTVPVATLMTAEGHVHLLAALRSAFGGSEAKRGHVAYRKLRSLYRGDMSMEAYLPAMALAMAECRNNGYTMSAKTATAIVLDQAGLDANQQASTVATAAMHSANGADDMVALTTALRDLWGGSAAPKSSPDATMMVVTYAEHQAYLAQRTTPTQPPAASGSDAYRPPRRDQVACWYCGKTGHVRRECRKLARDTAAKSPTAPAAPLAHPAAESGYVANETAHLVLVANGQDGPHLAAQPGDVILDIGATATIAGAAWISAYVARMTPTERTAIRSMEAAAVFTFGGGNTQRAYERVTLPVHIGGRRCLVQTWVVAGHLPLLMSRKTMSSLGIVLDVAGRRMSVQALDVTVGLNMSPAGHLTFNALDRGPGAGSTTTAPPAEAARGISLMAVLTKDSPDLVRAATKLHTQYGHCAASRLIELLKVQGVTDGAVFSAIENAVAACEACRQTAPRPPRPLVTMPSARSFNDTVAVDLAEVAPLGRFLHIIDLGTRFAKAVAVPNKETATITRALLSGWLVHYGSPRLLLSDPGREFDSALWRVMSERFNIGVASTAAQAHFSNGVVERHNLTLKTMVTRLHKDHPAAALQELLDLACLDKNSLGVHHGATPHQLMCGTNSRVPSTLTDDLPALCPREVAGDEALRSHLQLLHAARAAHAQAEADVSLRRALARNATNIPVRDWAVGDVVHYWTDGTTPVQGGWQGPAHVTDVAVAKRAVRLQHGNSWVTRHCSQIRAAGSQTHTAVPRSPAAAPAAEQAVCPAAGPTDPSLSLPDIGRRPPTPRATPPHPPAVSDGRASDGNASSEDDTDPDAVASMFANARAALDQASAAAPVSAPRTRDNGPPSRGTRSRTARPLPVLTAVGPFHTDTCHDLATPSQHIQPAVKGLAVVFPGPDTLEAALQRTGVAYHSAFLTRRELRRRAEVPIREAGSTFDEAIARELEAWADLAVYEEVPFTGQTVLSTRWVLTIKEPEAPTSAPRRKARLVVRGFEDPDRDAVDSTSPTASRATLRVVLSALASHGHVPRTVDVRTAFLQGMPLDRPEAVYVQPPPHARVPAGMVWRLRKCAYGLTDAPRRWYDSVLRLMMSLSLTRSTLDHGLFTAHTGGRLGLVAAVHVDDFLFGGTPEWVSRFEGALRAAFAAGPTKVGNLTFTGLNVRSDVEDETGRLTLRADQHAYVESIDEINIRPDRSSAPTARLTPVELTAYRRATGALLWATGQTMPYLACAASTLARRFTSAVVRDLTVANRVVAAAKAVRPLPLVFPPQQGPERLRLFIDASSVKQGVPTAHTGFAIFSSPARVPAGPLPPDAPLTLLQYASHRQRRVTHSSFAAEVYAMLEGMRAVKQLAAIHALVHCGDEYAQVPVDVYTDNLSLYNTLDADGVVQPKEVGAAVQELRELYHGGVMATVTWLRAPGQLADALTKPGRNTALQRMVQSNMYHVRLSPADYLTKTSQSASTLAARPACDGTGSAPRSADMANNDGGFAAGQM